MSRYFYIFKQLIQLGTGMAIKGFVNDVFGQMRRELLDKVIHESTQESAASETNFGHTRLKQVAGIQGDQITIGCIVVCHAGDDPYAQTKTDVSFDNVSIGSSKYHLRSKATVDKGFIQFGAAGKTKYVGHNRILGNFFKRQI